MVCQRPGSAVKQWSHFRDSIYLLGMANKSAFNNPSRIRAGRHHVEYVL